MSEGFYEKIPFWVFIRVSPNEGLGRELCLDRPFRCSSNGDEVVREEPRPEDLVGLDAGDGRRYLLPSSSFSISCPNSTLFDAVLITNVVTTRLRDMEKVLNEEDAAIRSQSSAVAAVEDGGNGATDEIK